MHAHVPLQGGQQMHTILTTAVSTLVLSSRVTMASDISNLQQAEEEYVECTA